MDTPKPYRTDVPRTDLDDLADRLARTRWPDEPPTTGWAYGVARAYLMDLVDHWRTGYDWRAHEARLNEIPQFTTTIDGQNIHFLHVRSPYPDATPLVITHGWPSTVHDFVDIIHPLTNPPDPADAFHVVAPSLPGFAFSGPTAETGWDAVRVARAWDELMRGLGYDRYGAQGGDLGSIIAPELGRVAPDRVIGVHVNALANAAMSADLDGLTPEDRDRVAANKRWWQGRSGYATQMSTRPQTLAYALNDSPAGQLAWNLEWFVDYDPTTTDQAPVDRDAILTNVSAFWFTRTAGSAARIYLEFAARAWGSRPERSPVPTGVANFRGDRAVHGLAERAHRITRWSAYDQGGHFASLQAPDQLVQDIRDFFRTC